MTDAETLVFDAASVSLRRELWDCAQLQLEAGKLENLQSASLTALVGAIELACDRAKALGLVHLAARLNTSARLEQTALQQSRFVLVDTVVHLELMLGEARFPASQPEGVTVRWADARDIDALGALSADAFSDPAASFNRYLNDGRFPLAAVRRVYETWARTSIEGAAGDAVLVAMQGQRLVGFLTLRFADAEGLARVPLNAVVHDVRGRGVYRALVLAAANAMHARGAQRLAVTTQLQQLAVQRTWLSLGARQTGSAYSFHRWLD